MDKDKEMLGAIDIIMITQEVHPLTSDILTEVWTKVCHRLWYDQKSFVQAGILKIKWISNHEILQILQFPNEIEELQKSILNEAIKYILELDSSNGLSPEEISKMAEESVKERKKHIQYMIEETTQEWSDDYDPEDDFILSRVWCNLEYPFSENEKKLFCTLKIRDLKKKKQ